MSSHKVRTEETDSLLWRQVKEGSESALGRLVHRYANALQNYGYKFVPDTDFVKDCVQEVFIEVWSRRQALAHPDSVRAYLLSSVRKRVLRQGFRQQIMRNDVPADLDDYAGFVEFSPEWLLIEQESVAEKAQRVATLLNQLPKRQREVVYLRFYQGLERDEIAQIMGVAPQSVSNLIQSAFKTFRELWTGTVFVWLCLRGC